MRTRILMLVLMTAVIGARPAAALELLGIFEGNDFYSEGNDRCTVCDILGDDETFLLAKLESEGGGESPELFELSFDDDRAGTWTRVEGTDAPTHLAVKAGPMFALYEITDADGDLWTTEALRNRGGQQPGMSHLSFYVKPAVVPEPAAWTALLIAGLGLGLRRLRGR